MRPVSSYATFLPLSCPEAHEIVLLLLIFNDSLSRPLKFWPVYALHDLLWKVMYFFFHSWSRFHPHPGMDGQEVVCHL